MSDPLKILLADDARFFRTIEKQFLQKTPVEILEAEDSTEVFVRLRSQKPDLVYLAFSLPGDGDGAATCRKIKHDPALRDIPIVIICDQSRPEQPEIARQSGCDACLVKPLDRFSFLQTGRQFLAGIREHRQPSFFSVSFSTAAEEHVGKCLDLSGGGIFIETPAEIAAGTLVNLQFKLPDNLGTMVSCSGEVMWINRRPKPMKPHYPHGLGVKFIGLPDIAHKAILKLTQRSTAGRSAR